MVNKMTYEKLKTNDLHEGDILLFSPCDDWESKLIAKMTDSDVTHSAMSYFDQKDIVEEMPPHAQVTVLKDRIEERTISVMRMKTDIKDFTPVLDRAKLYVDEKVPYSKVNLVFLGLYILIRKVFLKPNEQMLLRRLLQVATVEMIKLINEGVLHEKHPFVCSQFIFNCYYTAGEDYVLKLKPSCLGTSLLRQLHEYASLDAERTSLKTIEKNLENEEIDIEALIKELYEAFHASNKDDNRKEGISIKIQWDPDLIKATKDFIEVLDKAYDLKGREHQPPIDKLLAFEEYFVTPGDLLKNVENLYKVGELDNKAIHEGK